MELIDQDAHTICGSQAPIDNTLKELELGSKCLTKNEVAVVKDLAESLEIINDSAIALC